FTLNGCKGSASVTALTGLIAFNPFPYQSGRMEKDQMDWVTLPSLDLGRLSSLTIENGGGPGSGWHLGDVHVRSARWIESAYDTLNECSGSWNDWVEHGQPPVSVPLVATNFQEELPTIQCPAPMVVASAPDQCSATVSFSPTASDVCPGVVAVSD